MSEAPASPREISSLARPSVRPALLALAPLAAALLLWIVAIPAIDLGRMSDVGLVSVLPPSYYLALAALIGGFCLALALPGAPRWALSGYVAAWIVVIHATPAIVYDTLRYAWAWKHVGIVDYIQRHGAVDPAIASLPVYHNWPGFFGLATLFTEAAGVETALPLAIWSPVLFELLFAAGVLLILRACTPDWRLAWLGVWFFTLTNWVGQDYFAPQALTYVCYLALIGICLWAFSQPVTLAGTRVGRWLARWELLARLLAALDRRIARAEEAGSSLPVTTAGQRRGLLGIALCLMATIAVSHQLTPAVTVLSLAALVIFGICTAWGLPILMALFTAAWLVTGAADYAAIGLRDVAASFGRADQNVSANLIDASLFGPGVQLVSQIARGLTALVGLLAVAGWLRRFVQGYLDLGPTLLWLTPVSLLAMSGYGGEILFRVYFFALPFMAFYLAALLAPRPSVREWARSAVAVTAVSAVLAGGFLFAYFGHELSNTFRRGEVAATDYLVETAPGGSLVVEITPNYPSRYRRYDELVYVPLVPWARGNVEESVNSYTLEDIERMMADPAYPATYLIVTRGQLLELSRPGLESVESILAEIEASGHFTVVYDDPDATVYRYAGKSPEEAP